MRINHLVFPTVTPQQNPNQASQVKTAAQPLKQDPTASNSQAKAQTERSIARATPVLTPRPTPVDKSAVKPQPLPEPASRVIYTPADPAAKKALLEKMPLAKPTEPTAREPKPEQAKSMSLEGQLEMGKKMGLFTHITVSKDGVLSARPERVKTVASQEFVTSAVTTMKDFADGIAKLKQNIPETSVVFTPTSTNTPATVTTPAPKAMAVEPGEDMQKPSPFQQIAARLNIFA
jgi:hypothetical protein